MKFYKLVTFLTESGYYVRVRKIECEGKFQYWSAYYASPHTNIIFGFCEPNHDLSYTCLNGKIAADNYQCFDKWSKCPIVLPFPHGKLQKDFLLEKLKFLSTQAGYEWSNSYAYLDQPVIAYP